MNEKDSIALRPGSRVVIRQNPFQFGVEGIVATVVRFESGTGFMGCHLADIRYEDARDGAEHELPFATYNLDGGDRASRFGWRGRGSSREIA